MANKVAHISDLIHRVASSCLTHHGLPTNAADHLTFDARQEENPIVGDNNEEEEEEEEDDPLRIWEEEKGAEILDRLRDLEALVGDVFDTVSAVKKSYVALQEAHCPWDPDKMRAADAAVVAELRRLARLRDRFRRAGPTGAPPPIREVVAPYEAAIDDLRRELKVKESEIENLKEKLKASCTPRGGSGRKTRLPHGKRVGCITGSLGLPATPTAELFETCFEQVKSASRSFTAHLHSLMRSARWDIAAAARSIIDGDDDSHLASIPDVDPRHAKHALESYINRILFHGFENETFYIDGSLSSLLHPAEFRRDCFAQFRDMRAMDPAELLGILPTCHFGRFAAKKYLAVVHPRMEESLLGGAEQRRQVAAGAHPRTGLYGEFLRLAKAVWLLHLLAFALEPAPSHFEASKGAEFHPEYMESVVRFGGGRAPAGSVVGFSVGPGFKLGGGSVVKARVYLVPRL